MTRCSLRRQSSRQRSWRCARASRRALHCTRQVSGAVRPRASRRGQPGNRRPVRIGDRDPFARPGAHAVAPPGGAKAAGEGLAAATGDIVRGVVNEGDRASADGHGKHYRPRRRALARRARQADSNDRTAILRHECRWSGVEGPRPGSNRSASTPASRRYARVADSVVLACAAGLNPSPSTRCSGR